MLFVCGDVNAQKNSDQESREMLCSGKWVGFGTEHTGKTLSLSKRDEDAYIIFHGDGSVTTTSGQTDQVEGSGEWKLVKNKIILTIGDDTKVYKFNIKNENNQYFLYATLDLGDGPVTRVMIRRNY